MKIFIRFFPILLFSILLSGCDYLSKQRDDFEQKKQEIYKNNPPLELEKDK